MKTYIIIDEELGCCYMVFIAGSKLFYLSVDSKDTDDCKKLVHDYAECRSEMGTIKHLINNLDNYSREFFTKKYAWYNIEDLNK